MTALVLVVDGDDLHVLKVVFGQAEEIENGRLLGIGQVGTDGYNTAGIGERADRHRADSQSERRDAHGHGLDELL